MCKNSILVNNGSSVWELTAGKYRAYGIFESRLQISTEIYNPPYSTALTLNTPPTVRVKFEHDVHTVIHLSHSYDGDESIHFTPMVEPSSSSLGPLS